MSSILSPILKQVGGGGGSGLTPDQTIRLNAQLINVKETNGKTTGAIGDGSSHPLSEFYDTLAAAQADYPVATALTQETDGVVIEQMIADEKDFHIPPGT